MMPSPFEYPVPPLDDRDQRQSPQRTHARDFGAGLSMPRLPVSLEATGRRRSEERASRPPPPQGTRLSLSSCKSIDTAAAMK